MSRLLLDSHAMLWLVAHDSARSGTAKTLIEAADEVFVSEASAWEAAIKVHLGNRTVDAPSAEAFFDEQMLSSRGLPPDFLTRCSTKCGAYRLTSSVRSKRSYSTWTPRSLNDGAGSETFRGN